MRIYRSIGPLVVLLCASVSVVTASPGKGPIKATTLAPSNDNTSKDDKTAAAERAKYVQSILTRRLKYVLTGKRTRDFAKFVKEMKGEMTIYSMHGLAGVDEVALDAGHRLNEPGMLGKNKRDPFPSDRLLLDLVSIPGVSPPSLYKGEDVNTIDIKPPNIFQLLTRAIQLGFHFAPVLLTLFFAVFIPWFRQHVWYKWLASCIGSAGAAWIKWGQWSSTRNDMFPDALCDQLATLHNDAPAHSWKHSEQTLECSLGLAPGTLFDVFDQFDKEPIASGSIAQVHSAVLGGTQIAVKIRHPRVAQLIDLDFRLMSLVATITDWIPALSWLRIRDSVDQFSHTMAAQAYLNVEGHHLEVLNHNFRKWQHVRFPQPFYAGSSVIMETFEPGRIATSVIDSYDRLAEELNSEKDVVVEEVDGDSGSSDNNRLRGYEIMPITLARFLVTSGTSLYLKMLLVDNLMHADLHPGNILVAASNHGSFTKDEKLAVVQYNRKAILQETNEKYGITLVDAGMVAKLTDDESSTFIGLLSSLGEGDGKSAADFALHFSLENNFTEAERDEFRADMVEMFAERCQGYGTGVDVGHVLRGVLGLIRKHRVRIDANYATLVVNVLCVESLARDTCPGYNVLDASEPLLRAYRRLCYDKKGNPIPGARQSMLVKARMGLEYFRKNQADKAFFSDLASCRRRNPPITL